MHAIQHIPRVEAGDVHISWPAPGELARTVISRSNTKVTFKVPNLRTGKMLYAESANEKNFYVRIQLDPTVTQITPQPAVLYYLDSGIVRRHYPDVLVIRANVSKVFVEIKSSSDPELPEAHRRANLLIPGLQRQGFGYQLVTSDEIEKYPHLANARLLLRLGQRRVTAQEAARIIRMIEIFPNTSWQDIVSGKLGPQAPFQIARLILDGDLSFNSDKPLSGATQISSSSNLHVTGNKEKNNG